MKSIENPKLLDCYFKNGMMILPYYHSIINARLKQQKFASERRYKVSKKKKIISLLSGILHCKIKKKNILIFSSTLFNIENNGRFFNCLHGYYYNLYPNETLLIEDSDNNFNWRTKNSYDGLSFINTYIELLCLILQKVCHTFAPIYRDDYNVFIKEYPNLLSLERLSKDDYYTKFYAFFIKKLLKKVNPKIIIVNCGSYGHNAAIICFVAKQLGIKVIEPQHGVTYKSPGYTASDIIANSKEYTKYLPDVLFTFGEYWKTFVNWKYEILPVGYQHLNEYTQKMKHTKTNHDFLVISQPMNEQDEIKKVEFVKSLSKCFHKKKILFRIHPSENYEQQKTIYQDFKNIEISNSKKALYEDIKICRNIIGWYSNCLYECLAFEKTPIIVDTSYTREYFPNNIGIWIKSAEELSTIDLDALQSTKDYSLYWTSDFEKKVKEYIENI